MQQTTQVKNRAQTGTPADTGPYDYDLPVVGGIGQPVHVPRPASWRSGLGWKSVLSIFAATTGAQMLRDMSGWSMLQSYMLMYCVVTVFMYWDTPKPRRGFLPWTLKVVGIFLNAYVVLVTVPMSLRGLLPDWLAFGLPAFAFLMVFYWMPPLLRLNQKTPALWQWLLWAAAFSAFWGWFGPVTVR